MDIKTNIPLANKNWFRTGGAAKFFCEPIDQTEFSQALEFAQKTHCDIYLLGQGANVLINDNGVDGLVIRPQVKTLQVNTDDTVTAGAGVTLDELINFCLENNLSGLEEFSGIPGTVGGSVYINIHYFEFFLSNFLTRATVISKHTGKTQVVTKDWFNFSYDSSKLFEKEFYLVDATFNLKKIDDYQAAYAKGRKIEIIRHRNNRYPTERSCGSFFRNFLDHEVPFTIKGKKILAVAYYLDKLGIKGDLSVGKAIVFYKHANMIVSQDGATSENILQLARTIQELTKEKFGIVPTPECQFIGFNTTDKIVNVTYSTTTL